MWSAYTFVATAAVLLCSTSSEEDVTPPKDWDDDYPTPEMYNQEGLANCSSSGTHERVRVGILKLINWRRRKLARGNQENGFTKGIPKLPKAMFMRKMGWSCNLENAAIAALEESCAKHSRPVAPDGTTGFFDRIEKSEGQTWKEWEWRPWGPGLWFSEIDNFGLTMADSDIVKPGTVITYKEKSRESSNLLRYDAYRIGCAYTSCGENNTFDIFCLTNKPPLRRDAILYYVGNGTCRCQDNLVCQYATGLCVEQNWISTTTPTPTTTRGCYTPGFSLALIFNFFKQDSC